MTPHLVLKDPQAALAGAIAERNDFIARQARQMRFYVEENTALHHRNANLRNQNAMLRKRMLELEGRKP